MRWVREETRLLHPSADCLASLGYDIRPRPLHVDEAGDPWSAFEAVRGEERLLVRERIRDEGGRGWPDVSSWWWAAALGASGGPWWAITVAERGPSS